MHFRHVSAVLAMTLAALVQPGWAQTAIDTAARDFVAAENFEVLPVGNIEDAINDLLGADASAMVPADADISPIEKAFLMIDTQEVPLPRLRYVLRYSESVIEGVTLSLIQIERYNMGPSIREQVMQEYDSVAEPEVFGIGPHVMWRLVTQPTSKSAALLLDASRREIDDAEAAERSCLPRTCLSLDPMTDLADWSEGQSIEGPLRPVSYPALGPSEFAPEVEEVRPAYEALELAIAAGIASQDEAGILWSMPERQGEETASPFLVVLIDRNLGQDMGAQTALGIAKMGLDSEERWVRLAGGNYGDTLAQTLYRATGPLVLKARTPTPFR